MPEPNANPDFQGSPGPDLVAGETAAGSWPHLPRFGVYPAIVVDNVDPEGMGRVRVRLPWVPDSPDGEYRAWARMATLMAGHNRGTWFLPEVDDEVLVAFQGGDPARPVVVGALWNGQDRPPEESVDKKVIRSRGGLQITLDDAKSDEKLVLETPRGSQVILDDGEDEIRVQDRHGNLVRLHAGGITVSAAGGWSCRPAPWTWLQGW